MKKITILLLILFIISCSPNVELEQIFEEGQEDLVISHTLDNSINTPVPTILREGDTSVESYCGTVDQTWKVKFRNYVNEYHVNGYIIIETIIINYGRTINRVDTYYLLNDINPSVYIEGIHTERNNLAYSLYRKYDYEDIEKELKIITLANSNFFNLFRTAEDVVRASLMTSEEIVSWDEVLKAADRQKYRMTGISAP